MELRFLHLFGKKVEPVVKVAMDSCDRSVAPRNEKERWSCPGCRGTCGR